MNSDRDFESPAELSAITARSRGVTLRESQEQAWLRELPPQANALIQDLELDTLFEAMALGDRFLFNVARKAVLATLNDPGAILYRQRIMGDCLAQPAVVRGMYDVAVEAIAGERGVLGLSSWSSPSMVLSRSVQALKLLGGSLRKLRHIAEDHAAEFRSEGFVRLFEMLATELDDEYLQTVDDHLKALRFRRGPLISARLGKGNKGTDYVLRRSNEQPRGLRGLISRRKRPSYSFEIADRDEAGARALGELRNQGIDLAANAVAQSCDHILSFLSMLRSELAFYVGCLNLYERLTEKGEPASFPVPVAQGEARFSCRGLYDVCLSLTLSHRAVGNDVTGDGKSLVIITGANQGGKSTFLRSVGLAQLMMQCGMFVAAESFRAEVRGGVFTHFKREEDETMTSGKLDEELGRMRDVVDQLSSQGLLLCQ